MNRVRGFGVASFLSVLVFISGCSAGFSSNSSVNTLLSKEQHFTLKNLNGESVSLDGLLSKNKAVLVNFWATWCPFCLEEIPDLVKLKEKYKNSPLEIVGIDVGESAEQAGPFAKRMNINYPVLLDAENSVAESYKVAGIPTTFLVSADGKIIGEYHAFTPQLESDVEKALK